MMKIKTNKHVLSLMNFIFFTSFFLSACQTRSLELSSSKPSDNFQISATNLPSINAQKSAIVLSKVDTKKPVATSTCNAPINATVIVTSEEILGIGAEGEEVGFIENLLMQSGYVEVGRQDGVFDIQTDAAVRHFQLRNNLPVTGIVDEVTRNILTSPHPIPFYFSPAFPGEIPVVDPLKPICDDHALQDRLAILSYIQPGSEEWTTGAFGPETQGALIEFQKQYMTTQNGKVDLQTWRTLFSPIPQWTTAYPDIEADTWSTSIFPADPNVLAIAWDGQRLWMAVSKGTSIYENYLIRIDPNAHPAEAAMIIRPRDCDTDNAQIANMIYAGGKIWLLYYNDQTGNPIPLLQTVDPETGVAHTPFKFAACPDGYCVPASAMGTANGIVWAAASDRVYGIDLSSGSVTTSRPVGFLATGIMAYDGQCFWYMGEATVWSFNPQAGTCRASESINALSYGIPETDGKFVWTMNPDGSLSQLNLANGESTYTDPLVGSPSALAYGGSILWIADNANNTVVGMSPVDGGLGDPIQLDGDNPTLIIYASKHLWIYFQDSSSVQRVDIEQYEIAPAVHTTTTALTATYIPTPPVLARTLYLTTPNMEGDDVVILQQKLLSLGYSEVGVPDGVFGPLTYRAVRNFQEDNGLVVDGIVGPITWNQLFY